MHGYVCKGSSSERQQKSGCDTGGVFETICQSDSLHDDNAHLKCKKVIVISTCVSIFTCPEVLPVVTAITIPNTFCTITLIVKSNNFSTF